MELEATTLSTVSQSLPPPPDSQIFIMILPSVVALCVLKKLLGLALLFDITLTFSYRRSEVRTDLNLELGRDISKQQGTCQTRRRRSKSFVRSKPLFARGRGDSADYILPNAILSTFLFSFSSKTGVSVSFSAETLSKIGSLY